MNVVISMLGAVNVLLDVAGLLLWLGARAAWLAAPGAFTASFQPLLRQSRLPRWRAFVFAVSLLLLLLGRAWAYGRIGSELSWVPSVDLGVISLPFNSIQPGRMLLFSLTSFGAWLSVFYLWLLLLSVVNRAVADADPVQRWVRQHLGRVDRWPLVVKLCLPWILIAGFWVLIHPRLVWLGLAAPPKSVSHLWQQGSVLGLGFLLVWKYPIVAVLFLHVINSYLYLGNSSLWTSINATARNLVAPVRWLPLRLGRIDLAPLLVMAAALLGFTLLERGLREVFSRLPL